MSGWDESEARQLILRAAQKESAVPPTAPARVWRRLEARRTRPRPQLDWPMFIAGAACTAALMLLIMRSQPSPAPARALSIAAGPRELRAGDALPVLPQLSLVDLHDTGRIVVGANTAATLSRFDGSGVAIELRQGSLLAHVLPRHGREPFLVRTPRFVARVVGTVLRVEVHADGSSSLVVGHGAVELQPTGGATVLVRAGERWPADTNDAPSASELERLGALELEGVTAASFAPLPSVAVAPASCDADRSTAQALRCYLALGDDADRMRAENALFQAGWLALRELGEPARALRIWQRARARFPDGVLAAETQTSIIDALVALRRNERARRELDDYLAREPNGLRSAEMHFVRGALLRDADGDCHRAARDFALALHRPAEPWAARARTARAACAPAP